MNKMNYKDNIKRPELLIPAGSLEVLKVAVDYGADAVYIGGDVFSLRAKAKNFSAEDMAAGIEYAHSKNVRVHVTANILAHNGDIANAEEYFKQLKELKPDALIISDPGMFMTARRVCPEIDIHISTQANNTNYETCRFWYEQGAKRIVTARELSLKEIKEMREKIPADLELESFIHGAMCISYSGRCLLSNYFTGRDANRGACTHPCRWKYAVVEESRPGEYLPIEENERGTFIFNSKDLCMIEHIPELLDAGIDSYKIEGRMKTALYVATVARTYRRAIDRCLESREEYFANMDWYKKEIASCTYRQFTTGFYFGRTDENSQIYDSNTYINECIYLGKVAESRDEADSIRLYRLTQKNKFSVGEELEVMKKDGRDIHVKCVSMFDGDMNRIDSCPHPEMTVWFGLEKTDGTALSESEMPEEGELIRLRKSIKLNRRLIKNNVN